MFEEEIHNTIINYNLFKPGDTVAIGASGGKGKAVIHYFSRNIRISRT